MRGSQKITITSILILLLSQAFMIVLASNAFEKIHVASELARYAVSQKDFKRKVEAALRFGKPLDQLLGMDRLIAESAVGYNDLTNIAVYSSSGELLYSLHPPTDAPIPMDESGKTISVPDPLLEVVETSTSYLITLPLLGPGEQGVGAWASGGVESASVVFVFDKQGIREGVRLFWEQRLALGGIVAGCASLLLFFLLYRVSGTNVSILRRRIFTRVLVVVILAQVAFAGINAYRFHQDHVHLLQERVRAQLTLLQDEVQRVLARGITLDRISRMDKYLMEIVNNNPEVTSMSIRDDGGRPVGQAGKTGMDHDALSEREDTADTDDRFSVTLPLKHPREGTIAGDLRADLDRNALWALIWKILLDSLTVILIASLFIVEQIYFLVSRIGTRAAVTPEPAMSGRTVGGAAMSPPKFMSDQEVLDRLMLARFAAFAFLFAFALPVSFVPLQMKELYTPLLGLPRSVILGLPISLEMLCTLFSALAAGAVADRRGWRIPFLVGIVVTALGMLFCAMASTGYQFILARGFCGLGYGLSWMSLQTYLYSNATPTTRARGTSHYVAGIFSGHICGTALGAMLAERFGYAMVFQLGAVLALCSLLFFFLFMRGMGGVSGQARPQPVAAAFGVPSQPGALASYFKDRNTLLLMICCVIPFSVCQVGLLFFATPLYLNQLGVSQSDIGRVLMIYGLSVVYLAPQMSKIVDRHERKGLFIAIGGLLGGLGLSLLFVYQGFAMVAGAIFLLGLASSIGSSAQTAFALKLRSTQELGMGKAMAIQRAADKLGQMLGPLALGALMSGISISQGLVVLGVGYMVVSLIFLLLARERVGSFTR